MSRLKIKTYMQRIKMSRRPTKTDCDFFKKRHGKNIKPKNKS